MLPFNSSNPARLDRLITLRYPLTSRDAAGGTVTTWVDAATPWADWTPQTGREIQQAGQKLAIQVGTLRIRHRTDIDATWRAVMGETVFELLAPPVEIGRRVYLDLAVRSLNPAPAAEVVSLLLLGGTVFEFLDLGDGAQSLDLGGAAA